MTFFLFISVCYLVTLLYYRPSPSSLKEKPMSFSENFNAIKASLFSGLLILVTFLFTSDLEFKVVNESLFELFALNNSQKASSYWPIQALTHLFIHINLYHVLANVFALGVASAYERRVGSKRFVIVLIVASIASIPSILFYSEPTAVCGISGGVFGLAAAYFTDHEEMTTKEWIYAVLLAAFLITIFTLEGEFKSRSASKLDFKVDHIAHILGAIGAVIYCRFTSKHLTRKYS